MFLSRKITFVSKPAKNRFSQVFSLLTWNLGFKILSQIGNTNDHKVLLDMAFCWTTHPKLALFRTAIPTFFCPALFKKVLTCAHTFKSFWTALKWSVRNLYGKIGYYGFYLAAFGMLPCASEVCEQPNLKILCWRNNLSVFENVSEKFVQNPFLPILHKN